MSRAEEAAVSARILDNTGARLQASDHYQLASSCLLYDLTSSTSLALPRRQPAEPHYSGYTIIISYPENRTIRLPNLNIKVACLRQLMHRHSHAMSVSA